jgi:hypothetical protein
MLAMRGVSLSYETVREWLPEQRLALGTSLVLFLPCRTRSLNLSQYRRFIFERARRTSPWSGLGPMSSLYS